MNGGPLCGTSTLDHTGPSGQGGSMHVKTKIRAGDTTPGEFPWQLG